MTPILIMVFGFIVVFTIYTVMLSEEPLTAPEQPRTAPEPV